MLFFSDAACMPQSSITVPPGNGMVNADDPWPIEGKPTPASADFALPRIPAKAIGAGRSILQNRGARLLASFPQSGKEAFANLPLSLRNRPGRQRPLHNNDQFG
jgi:hypothetical protein